MPISSAICIRLVMLIMFWSIIPFPTISNYKLYETNVGKIIKFKALTRKQNSKNQDVIEKLNNVMDDPEPEIVSRKYFEPHEFTHLLKKEESQSFRHLNISLLPFHVEKFSRLLSSYKLPFDYNWIQIKNKQASTYPGSITRLQFWIISHRK